MTAMTGPTDIRAGRYAENEAAYRRINERIRKYEERDDQLEGDPLTFLCECAEGACIAQIHVSLDEYGQVRQHGRRFIVAPHHDAPELEHVVERHPHYWVVEKDADPGSRAWDTAQPCVASGGPPSQVAHVAPPEKKDAITGVCPQCGHELVLDDRGLLPWHPKHHDPTDE
jgi:hypothetical protein